MANAIVPALGLAMLACATVAAGAGNRVASAMEFGSSPNAVLSPLSIPAQASPAIDTRALNIEKPAQTLQKVALSDAELAGFRGGQNIVIGNQTLNSNTSGNTIDGNYLAGAINISNSAFSNFNGVGNFAVNTGAQVSLQSAVNLTINVSP